MRGRIYLDHHATTPCDPAVVEAMLPYFRDTYGNPSSSVHEAGRIAADAVELSRERVATLIGAMRGEVVFTAGATESNNLALLGLARGIRGNRRRIVTTAIEHKAVLGPYEELKKQGFETVILPVDGEGKVDLMAAEEAITEDALVVSVQAANNEIGTIQPVAQLAQLAHDKGALVHCDAAQAVGKIPVDVDAWGVDLLSISAHKLYGPKGVGALYVRGGPFALPISPLLIGGGQEKGLRAGTLNVPGIVGLGEACSLSEQLLPEESTYIGGLRDRLEEGILEVAPSVKRNGNLDNRLPGNSSLTFPGIDAEALIVNAPELAISTGSACTSGAPEPSHVLLALGLGRDEASSTIRIGVGRFNTKEEIDEAANVIARAVRRLSGRQATQGHRRETVGDGQGGLVEDDKPLSRYCIYTIRHTDVLDGVYENGGSSEFTESNRWVEGEKLFREAERSGEKMPILFAPAEKDGGLVYRATLASVRFDDSDPDSPKTKYRFTDLTRLEGEFPNSSLVKKSDGKPLSDNYIRPYAVCNTPDFVQP